MLKRTKIQGFFENGNAMMEEAEELGVDDTHTLSSEVPSKEKLGNRILGDGEEKEDEDEDEEKHAIDASELLTAESIEKRTLPEKKRKRSNSVASTISLGSPLYDNDLTPPESPLKPRKLDLNGAEAEDLEEEEKFRTVSPASLSRSSSGTLFTYSERQGITQAKVLPPELQELANRLVKKTKEYPPEYADKVMAVITEELAACNKELILLKND
ncbi:MAG: hypothetical protein K0S63_1011 [Gammaproteobacteria bacterium]|jgi:hypothetical protein|nr:hypothetical protein [Gammaproteobacteria bacterium]